MLTQRGFNLIELMVALVVSGLVINIVFAIYLGSMQSQLLIRSLDKIQSDASTAIAMLRADIHQAGYMGCTGSRLPLSITEHELTSRYAAFPAAAVIKAERDTVYVTNDIHFKVGDKVIIADCKHAEVMSISKVNNKVYFTQPLQYQYDKSAQMSRMVSHRYFIGHTKRKDERGDAVKALFVEDIKRNKVELIEGISEFNIKQSQNLIHIDFKITANGLEKTWHLSSFTSPLVGVYTKRRVRGVFSGG